MLAVKLDLERRIVQPEKCFYHPFEFFLKKMIFQI
jgi:hypothetical protein